MTPEQQAARWLADCQRYDSDGDPSGQFDHKIFVKEADALAAIARHLAPGDDLVERLSDPWQHSENLCREAAARLSALTAERDALRDRMARMEGALVAEREENLWNCYNIGAERNGRWSDCGMSDAEWLIRQCGFDPDQRDYDAAEVKAAIPIAARAAITEGGSNG